MKLDAGILSQIRGLGGEELLRKLARLYLEHTPLRLEEVRRGIAAQDWKRTARAIHSVRSSSATLGAVDLAETAADMEALADEEHRAELEAGLPDLEKKIGEALGALTELA